MLEVPPDVDRWTTLEAGLLLSRPSRKLACGALGRIRPRSGSGDSQWAGGRIDDRPRGSGVDARHGSRADPVGGEGPAASRGANGQRRSAAPASATGVTRRAQLLPAAWCSTAGAATCIQASPGWPRSTTWSTTELSTSQRRSTRSLLPVRAGSRSIGKRGPASSRSTFHSAIARPSPRSGCCGRFRRSRFDGGGRGSRRAVGLGRRSSRTWTLPKGLPPSLTACALRSRGCPLGRSSVISAVASTPGFASDSSPSSAAATSRRSPWTPTRERTASVESQRSSPQRAAFLTRRSSAPPRTTGADLEVRSLRVDYQVPRPPWRMPVLAAPARHRRDLGRRVRLRLHGRAQRSVLHRRNHRHPRRRRGSRERLGRNARATGPPDTLDVRLTGSVPPFGRPRTGNTWPSRSASADTPPGRS